MAIRLPWQPQHLWEPKAFQDLMGDWIEREAGSNGGGTSKFPKVRGFMPFVNQYSPPAQNTVTLAACKRDTVGTEWLALRTVFSDS